MGFGAHPLSTNSGEGGPTLKASHIPKGSHAANGAPGQRAPALRGAVCGAFASCALEGQIIGLAFQFPGTQFEQCLLIIDVVMGIMHVPELP